MAVPEPDRRLTDVLSHSEDNSGDQSSARDGNLKLFLNSDQLSVLRGVLANNAQEREQNVQNISISNAKLEVKDLELAETLAFSAATALELTQRTGQLRESNHFLQARTAELEKLNQELTNLMKQREDFVASLTHDLKNPLIAAMRQLEFILDGKASGEEQTKILLQLLDSNKIMLRMVWNLLDVYRHEAGLLIPCLEPVDVTALIKQCTDDFSIGLKEKQILLRCSISGQLGPVITDRILLRRVIINILDNAVKFTPQDGSITVDCFQNGEKISIRVEDTGYGMSEQQLSKLFQRFWQTERARSNGLGSGLGLFLSKQIMNVLNGTIECTSQIDVGTAFIITLQA